MSLHNLKSFDPFTAKKENVAKESSHFMTPEGIKVQTSYEKDDLKGVEHLG